MNDAKPRYSVYSPPIGGYVVRYPSEWTVEYDEGEGQVSIFPGGEVVAVTISSARHQNSKHVSDARKHVRDFCKFAPRQSVRFDGTNESLASARLTDAEGVPWYVVARARENRVVVASLNGSGDGGSDSVWDEGEAILDSLLIL